MRLFRFDREKGKIIRKFQSHGVRITPVLRRDGFTQIGCLHLDPGSVLGCHPAAGPQLFLVVGGEGWVRTEADGKVPIRAGQAAFWEEGEDHESGTDAGMTVIIVEGGKMRPGEWMEEVGRKST
ncbi:hypothetical protein C8P63_11852 [Melghirimyces profundicolus]|uniref:Cupin domain n=1 Tax=Melghirimyces profundicolus TaxID=1242148 RepID=A0A2T6BQ18_9BACL|nr:cupin [Melghirimyces profundicolus]PTX58178.1 hypothetical protein C8P63_11852 [Melghirimyces profundicolus]